MCRFARRLLPLLLLPLAWPSIVAAQTLFSDGFESANTLAWAAAPGETPPPAADVFRFADLDLRDPHVYVDTGIVGCVDVTDNGLPGFPSFNAQVATAITTDGNGDTYLDASYLLEFRPFDALAVGLRLDVANGLCTAPVAGTSCAPDPASVPTSTVYSGVAVGSCLAPLAGSTYGPYSPDPAAPAAPCFVSTGRNLTFTSGGLPLPLVDFQVAAVLVGNPVTGMTTGLMRGFLSEASAATVLLPASLPLVGGQPLTVVLPGGAGSCASHDDRDTYHGVSGWWFYFDFTASPVPFTGP
jgi:hypothetical protein